jgi:hypothetical protein
MFFLFQEVTIKILMWSGESRWIIVHQLIDCSHQALAASFCFMYLPIFIFLFNFKHVDVVLVLQLPLQTCWCVCCVCVLSFVAVAEYMLPLEGPREDDEQEKMISNRHLEIISWSWLKRLTEIMMQWEAHLLLSFTECCRKCVDYDR